MICSNTLQTTFLFLNRWLCNSFFEPYCQLSRILWVLKPEMLKSTPGWADLLLPLCFHQFPFHLISAERHGSLSVRTWYSYQCPKNFFFFKTDLIFVYLCVSLCIHFQNLPFVTTLCFFGLMKWSIKGILKNVI